MRQNSNHGNCDKQVIHFSKYLLKLFTALDGDFKSQVKLILPLASDFAHPTWSLRLPNGIRNIRCSHAYPQI
jgi:hypothetical protein